MKKNKRKFRNFTLSLIPIALFTLVAIDFSISLKINNINNYISNYITINNSYTFGGVNDTSFGGLENTNALDAEDEIEVQDKDFQRPTYSLKEINSGVLGNSITFNSIVYDETTDADRYAEGMIIDENDFVGAREDTGVNAGHKNIWQSSAIIAEDGKTYLVRLYVHNNSPLGEAATAEGVKIRFDVPDRSDTEVGVTGWLTAANAIPDTYVDNVVFMSRNGAPFHLEYVPGSAFIENNGFASGGGATLPDGVVNQGNPNADIEDCWTLIGYNGPDGKVPGCYAYANYCGIKVKVVYD